MLQTPLILAAFRWSRSRSSTSLGQRARPRTAHSASGPSPGGCGARRARPRKARPRAGGVTRTAWGDPPAPPHPLPAHPGSGEEPRTRTDLRTRTEHRPFPPALTHLAGPRSPRRGHGPGPAPPTPHRLASAGQSPPGPSARGGGTNPRGGATCPASRRAGGRGRGKWKWKEMREAARPGIGGERVRRSQWGGERGKGRG